MLLSFQTATPQTILLFLLWEIFKSLKIAFLSQTSWLFSVIKSANCISFWSLRIYLPECFSSFTLADWGAEIQMKCIKGEIIRVVTKRADLIPNQSLQVFIFCEISPNTAACAQGAAKKENWGGRRLALPFYRLLASVSLLELPWLFT